MLSARAVQQRLWNTGLITLWRNHAFPNEAAVDDLMARQVRLARRKAESWLGFLAGPSGRFLVYDYFVGRYFFYNTAKDGRINMASPERTFLTGAWSVPRNEAGFPQYREILGSQACVLCQNSDSHDIPKRRPTALGDVANTDTKLLICSLFQKSRVLAQDGVSRAAKPARVARFTLDAPEHSGTIPGARGDILTPGVALTSNLAVIFTLNQHTCLNRAINAGSTFLRSTTGDRRTDDAAGVSAIKCWWLPRNPLVC